MNEQGLCPLRRKRKGKPQNSWMQELTGMREKEINSKEWIDREQWSRNNKYINLQSIIHRILTVLRLYVNE